MGHCRVPVASFSCRTPSTQDVSWPFKPAPSPPPTAGKRPVPSRRPRPRCGPCRHAWTRARRGSNANAIGCKAPLRLPLPDNVPCRKRPCASGPWKQSRARQRGSWRRTPPGPLPRPCCPRLSRGRPWPRSTLTSGDVGCAMTLLPGTPSRNSTCRLTSAACVGLNMCSNCGDSASEGQQPLGP